MKMKNEKIYKLHNKCIKSILRKRAQTHKWNNFHFGISLKRFSFTTATTLICKAFFSPTQDPYSIKTLSG